ncbi:hypothetical protein RhiLY_02474 [Ceratobasidium sp. AG-Ba]|nr:hypothetical protein RhiLY_02474 [Ceratobasidium sp. AG-Ba]
MSQVLQAQARTRAQGEAHAHAQVQVPAQRHQSLRPSPEQEHGSRASMPDLEQPKMEIDRQDAILSPASDPGPVGGRETHLRWAGHRNQRTFRWDLHPRQQQLNLPLPPSLVSTNREVQELLDDNERVPFNMCQMIQWCLPDEFSCLPSLSTSLLHTLDGLYLQQRPVLPVEKEDAEHLLMEDM